MKFSKLALAAALSCALITLQAAGQGVVQPAKVRSSNFTSNYYQQDDTITSPSDVVPASCDGNGCDGNGCDGNGCDGNGCDSTLR